MRIRRFLVMGGIALGLLILWVRWPSERAQLGELPRPATVGTDSTVERDPAQRGAGGVDAAPAPPSEPPPVDDPAALERWFESRVLAALPPEAPVADAISAANPAVPQGLATFRAALGRDDRGVDWNYVLDVFSGHVSGIPDEGRAGMSLQELDRLGDVPHLEKLRQEQRYEELRELGFENENAPWPSCIRSGTCRRDRRSSPPA